MGKFLCVCGAIIRITGEIPNPQEWHLISDDDFDRFWERPVSAEQISDAMTFAYRCPESDHLWIFWDGLGADPTLYSPTDYPRD